MIDKILYFALLINLFYTHTIDLLITTDELKKILLTEAVNIVKKNIKNNDGISSEKIYHHYYNQYNDSLTKTLENSKAFNDMIFLATSLDKNLLKNTEEGKKYYTQNPETMRLFQVQDFFTGDAENTMFNTEPSPPIPLSPESKFTIAQNVQELLLQKLLTLPKPVIENMIENHPGHWNLFLKNILPEFNNEKRASEWIVKSPVSPDFISHFFDKIKQTPENEAHIKTLNTIVTNTQAKKSKQNTISAFQVGLAISAISTISFIASQTIAHYLSPYWNRHVKYKTFLNKINPIILSQNEYSLDKIYGYKKIKDIFQEINNKLQKQKQKKTRIEGIVLEGPPGNGKTFFVKSLAASSGLPLFVISLNVLLNEAGQIDENLKILFEEVRRQAPCILFFDEFDLIVASRQEGKLTDQEKQILNQLLHLLDGDKPNLGVLVITNTNYISNIDSALLRHQRLGVTITIDNPTPTDIKEICKGLISELKIPIDNFEKLYPSLEQKIETLKTKNVVSIKQYLDKINEITKEHKIKKLTEDVLKQINNLIYFY
jgi:hypothetical protein